MRGQLGRGAPSFFADQRVPSTPQIFNNSQSRGGNHKKLKCFYLFAKLRKASFSMIPDSFVILFNLYIKISTYQMVICPLLLTNNAISAIKSSGQVVQ